MVIVYAILNQTANEGFQVVLIFIRIQDVETSKQRVAMRVLQGGHDVPDEKLEARFARTIANLERAIESLPLAVIFENSDLASPYRLEQVFLDGSTAKRS